MNGVPMKFDYSKTINEQLPTFEYYKNRYCSYELQIMNLQKQNAELEEENKRLHIRLEDRAYEELKVGYDKLKKENEKNKEFLNKLGFANVEQVGLSYTALKVENEGLKNNWNELKKEFEEELHIIKTTYSQINGNYFMQNDKIKCIENILDRMQELEEKEVK